ncbi:50S ribosomal protein L13 [Patescibacteria group bacterium]|nr:50S ribosomal protein L13 [Patescibacteria group bacterium]
MKQNKSVRTRQTSEKEIKRDWYLFDLKEKNLGRTSSAIAEILMGKTKPYFVRHLDCGDFVVAVNAREIKVTGKKESSKVYYAYSGYPGGLKTKTLGKLREDNPERIIYHAVRGMLPQNRLRDRMLARLFVFPGHEHKFSDKKFEKSL